MCTMETKSFVDNWSEATEKAEKMVEWWLA
jgi:hypothetical protein